MAKYIDSAYNNKTEFIRNWLDKNLLPDAKSFRVQSGYFSYAAIEPFVQVLKNVATTGESVKFVLGSNGGSLIAKDAKGVLEITKGRMPSFTRNATTLKEAMILRPF